MMEIFQFYRSIALMPLGKQLERRVRRQTKSVPQSLINIQPQLARIVSDREEKLVPIYQVGIGQIISIFPGEMSPVDGIIIAEESMVDRSLPNSRGLDPPAVW